MSLKSIEPLSALSTYQHLHDHISVEDTDGPQHRFDPHHHGRGCE